IADAVYGLSHLFSGGPDPSAPFDACGTDPTQPFALSCNSYPPCAGATGIDLAGHVLRRIAYGPTPDLLEYVQDIGAEAYIAEQLDPDSIDESTNGDLNGIVNTLLPETNRNDLYKLHIARGLYSDKQLLEQLTDFWNVHFNTYYWVLRNHFWFELNGAYNNSEAQVEATRLEYTESETFRSLALGSFEDLLIASATSPAMLIYLDSDNNIVGNANENYARELMELHTLDVDVVYNQDDIRAVAKCFTGWTLRKKAPADYGDPFAPALPDNDPTGIWSFHFEPANHDYTEKTIFAGTIYEFTIPAGDSVGNPNAGIDDGFAVIAFLSDMQETAEFISRKLIQKFVSDDVPPALLAACLGTWFSTDGDMLSVMTTILNSPEFLGNEYRWDKIDTPMESILSKVRGFGGYTTGQVVVNVLADLNHLPHNFSTPDGFPEVDLLGTHKLLYRIQFNTRTYNNSDPDYDFTALLTDAGVTLDDVDAVVDHLMALLFQSNFTAADRAKAIAYLETDESGVSTPLDPLDPSYDQRIRQLAAFLASYPQSLQQ
ncbi:MAG: DUF1800 domain-containing protein, partial [Planctomycetota bacterium]